MPLNPGSSIEWNVRFCADCYQQMRKASIAFAGPEKPAEGLVRLSGDANQLSATLHTPDTLPEQGLYLWLIVEGWDEQDYSLSWKVV